jgi:hypothetical protein
MCCEQYCTVALFHIFGELAFLTFGSREDRPAEEEVWVKQVSLKTVLQEMLFS